MRRVILERGLYDAIPKFFNYHLYRLRSAIAEYSRSQLSPIQRAFTIVNPGISILLRDYE